MTWKVNREVAVHLGGMRALLMQIAHPKVAQGVADHSDFRGNPLGRLRRTFDTVHAMVYGTRDEAVQAAIRLHRVHQSIRGELATPVAGLTPDYRANDSELLLWVFATLIDSAILSYELFLRPLSPAEKQQLYGESKVFARLSGVPPEALPADYDAFTDYVSGMIDNGPLVITPIAAEIADTLLKGPPPLYPFQPSNYVLAAGMLPEQLRVRLGISWNLPVHAAWAIGRRVVRRVVPRMPEALRYVPSSRRAVRRCLALETLERPAA